MKNIPQKIYLQINCAGDLPDDFDELEAISWCTDRIYDDDIEYELTPKKRCKACGREAAIGEEYCDVCSCRGDY